MLGALGKSGLLGGLDEVRIEVTAAEEELDGRAVTPPSP